MTAAGTVHKPLLRRRPLSRWFHLVAGVVAMMGIACVLYVWPLLRSGPSTGLAEALAATENAFAAFIIAETAFASIEAWLCDTCPRWLLVGVGAALVLLGALGGTHAGSVRAQVAWYALGGAGAGFVYGGTLAKTLKRFTDRKALCVGVTAGACAAVVALALAAYAVAQSASSDALPALIVLGAGQAVIIVVATLFILDPPPPDDGERVHD
jgi:OFA family oxalate/formate antiporter-like MFS transporter